MKKNLYILIENTKRELDSKLFLSLKLLQKNYNVIVGHKGTMWNLFPYLEPGIVFLKSYGPRNKKIIEYLKKRNFKLVCCDEEMIAPLDIKTTIYHRNDLTNFEKLDLLFTIGDEDTDVLKNLNNNSQKIHKTGSLRIDILKDPVNKIFENQSKEIKSKYGEFILLATGFPRANPLNQDPYSGMDHVFNMIVTGHNPEELLYTPQFLEIGKKLISFQRHMMEMFIYLIIEFNKNYPNKKIIIKPHTLEKVGFWKHVVAKRNLKNIEVIDDQEKSTIPWILASDCILTSNSTIAVESFVLKKKCINYLPNEDFWKVEKQLLKDTSLVIRNQDKLIEALKNLDSMNTDYLKSNTENYVKNSSNESFAINIILNKLEKLDINLSKGEILNINKKIYLIYLNFFRKVKNFIKKCLFFKNTNYEYKMHRNKMGNIFVLKNIQKRTIEIGKILGVKNPKVKQIIPLVFKIYE
tara:strand:- start:10736 stop:12133 length:1398 start_codon:yes stop_codon:yes gene_type:complete